jgi:AraC-like DNA-binding protein
MKILAIHLKKFMDYAQLRGIAHNELVQSIKNPPADFNDPHAKVDMADYYTVVELISRSLGDDLLGLRVGSHLNLNTLGVIYKISLKSTTNEEALFYCHSYLQKTFPSLNIVKSVTRRSAMFELNMSTGAAQVNRIILETLLTIMAREIQAISGEQTNIRLSSPYYTKDYPSNWAKGSSFAIKFQQTILKAALKDNSRWGLDVLIPEYLMLIQHMRPEKSFADKVKIAVLNLAKPTLPDLQMVADGFNLNERTFQRRLLAEGITFRQIIDELKQTISDLLIRHNRFSVADISSLLGYSEPSAFIHAFKKWHGKPPQQARKKTMPDTRERSTRIRVR